MMHSVLLVGVQRVAVVAQDILDVRRGVRVLEVVVVNHHIVEVVIIVAEVLRRERFHVPGTIPVLVEHDLLVLDDVRRRNV